MKFSQIKETCLYSHDLKKSEIFYTEILGLNIIDKVKGRHVFFRVGTSVLLIFNPEATSKETNLPPHDGEGRIHLALEVDKSNYESCKQELAAKNIAILHEHIWKNGRSFYFNDPDGHLLEILEGDDIWT